MFASTLAILAALAPTVLATVYITDPIASTSWQAGTQQTITWQDDGVAPSLAQFGPAKISIYVGNAQQQTMLQSISTSTDVSKVSSLSFTPDPTIGPNSGVYFIRVESLSLKDAKSPQYPALAFSAKFTLTGMTGKFTDAEQSQIDGASTAPLGGPTVTAVLTSTSTVAPSTMVTTRASTPAASASAKPSASSTSGASARTVAGGFVLAAGAAAAVFSLVL